MQAVLKLNIDLQLFNLKMTYRILQKLWLQDWKAEGISGCSAGAVLCTRSKTAKVPPALEQLLLHSIEEFST